MKNKLKLPCMIPSNLPNTSFCNMGPESAEAVSLLLLPLQAFARWHRDLLQQLIQYRQAKGKIHKLEHWGITCRVHAVGLTASPGVIPSSHQCCGKWEFCMPLSWMLGLNFPIQMLLNGKREGMTKVNGRSSRDAALLAGAVSRWLSWSSVQPLPSPAPASGPHCSDNPSPLHYQQVQTPEFIWLSQ